MTTPHKRRVPVKQVRKHFDGRCFVCGEADYHLLDAHRILPGEQGGTYHWQNILTLCTKCHRKIDHRRLVVHGKFQATTGHYLIHYTLDGVEKWEREDKYHDAQRNPGEGRPGVAGP